MNDPGELIVTERAALALWLLMQKPMSTAEVARWCGLTDEGARQMLIKISRVVPLYHAEHLWSIQRDGQNQ